MALQKNHITDRITVVGGGTSGYLTVLYFCRMYPNIHVTWIYPEKNNPIGVGEATVPQVQRFLGMLGVSMKDMILHCNANLKIGARFEGWSANRPHFFHPFGGTDEKCMDLEWMLLNDQLPPDILETYPDDVAIREKDDYPMFAANFDVRELCAYLDTILAGFGNLTVERRTVTSVSEISDDYIVDATGFSKTLINKDDPDNFKSIRHIIPNNSAMVYRAQYTDKTIQQRAYTRITAMDYGWIWSNPLKNEITFGYVYDDKYDVRDEYIDFVESTLGAPIDRNKVNVVKMITGRNVNHIRHEGNKTVYSIGLSSYFIEPLEATGLYLSAYGIELLDKLLKEEITEQHYNNEYNREFDAVTDFICAFYKYCHKSNEYWDHYKKLNIEKHRPNGIFPPRSWNLILSGLDQEERKYKIDPLRVLKIRKGNVKYHQWLTDYHARYGI